MGAVRYQQGHCLLGRSRMRQTNGPAVALLAMLLLAFFLLGCTAETHTIKETRFQVDSTCIIFSTDGQRLVVSVPWCRAYQPGDTLISINWMRP